MVDSKKLESLAFRLSDLESLRRLFAELNYEFADEPVYTRDWNQSLKETVIDSRIIAKKHDFLIYYIKTESNSIKNWKSVATKIISSNNGFCLVCSHNPKGFQWIFSGLSKEYSKSFSETRHVPIELKPNMGVPKPLLEFLESIEVSEVDKGVTILSKISEAFDKFSLQIHEELTVNVFEALKILAEGFTQNKSNNFELSNETLEKIREPIFILLYRIIFVLYAEDRSIFPVENKIYNDEFSLKWTKHNWILHSGNIEKLKEYEVQHRLKRLFRLIEVGSEELDYDKDQFFMRSYYGRIFDKRINFQLDSWNIQNKYLIKVLDLLTRTRDKKGNYFFLDYAALETRHLGAIYEHLLEFHLQTQNGRIAELPNSEERKFSGSYYTPKFLIDFIVATAIEPIIQRIIKNTSDVETQIEKILSLKILDPAMGSAHFLVGAVEYLAKRICEVEFGNVEELKYVERKRDVVRRCIYGVDKNPLAVDLAKLSLWLETISSEKPLSFLSAHLKHGNSLMGEHVESIFEPQQTLFETKSRHHLKKAVSEFLSFESLEDDSSSIVRAKIEKYQKMRDRNSFYYKLRGVLDNIIANKFGVKIDPIGDLRQKIGIESIDFYSSESGKSVFDLHKKYGFYHWEIEFPEIFFERDGSPKNKGGFDIIIGNPPWEILKPDVDEFFGPLFQLKSSLKFSQLTKDKKKKIMDELLKEKVILEQWQEYQNSISEQVNFFKHSHYDNQYGEIDGKKITGDFNLYKLFLERCYDLLKDEGFCGILIPSNWYSDLGTKKLRELLFHNAKIKSIVSFDNKKGIFKGLHRQYKFMTLVFQKGGKTGSFDAGFYLRSPEDLLNFPKTKFNYSLSLVEKTSPSAFSLIECKSEFEKFLIEKLFRFPLLGNAEYWKVQLTREFDMTNDAKIFNTNKKGKPLFEGKMIHQFQHNLAKPRYWIEEKLGLEKLTGGKRKNKNFQSSTDKIPLDFEEYRLAWRSVGRATDTRTLIGTIVPSNIFLGNSLIAVKVFSYKGKVVERIITTQELLYLCGLINSFVVDFILRLRVAANINMFYTYELPIPKLEENNSLLQKIVKLVGKLICTSKEFDNLRKKIHLDSGEPDLNKREELIIELNSEIAHLYELEKKELSYILDSFPNVKNDLKEKILKNFSR